MLWIAVGAVALFCGVLLYRHFARSKPTEPEQSVGALPDTAELCSFFWRQSAENADECYTVSFGAAENMETEGRYLNGVFRTPDGDVAAYTDVPVTDAQWRELETTLRGVSLPPYAPPDPHLLDATDSCIEIDWAENGNRFTHRYNGAYAHELHSFLLTLIGHITE